MIKRILIFLSILFSVNFARADYITHDVNNGCATNDLYVAKYTVAEQCSSSTNDLYVANFEPEPITCTSGQYLPAGTMACSACPNGYACPGGTYAYNANSDQGKGKFTLTTTNTTTSFQFSMSAVGTFTVDCGDIGTLTSSASPTDVSNGNTITRSSTTATTYTCTWSSAGAHTILFSGTATNYRTDIYTAAISFSIGSSSVNSVKIASISGNLSTIFPYISGNAASGAQPRFYNTFSTALNLTSIPNTLFADYTSAATHMFYYTFQDCIGLTSLPSGLFSTITSGANSMFYYTFDGCTGLTSLPSGLFFPNATTVSGEQYMFYGTFFGCTGLTSLPSGLFFPNATTVSGAKAMFYGTFSGCTGLTSIPSGLFFPNAQSVSGAQNMFQSTFSGCTGLTSLPSGLFSKITSGANSMFEYTFDGCTNLGCSAKGCSTGTGYIPPDLFAGITPRGSNAENTMYYTFQNTKLVYTCPTGTIQSVTDWEGPFTWNYKVACEPVYTCAPGQYLPANQTSCASCPSGKVCPGGTYPLRNFDQGAALAQYTCTSGQYVPAGETTCSSCPNGYVCPGGTLYVYDTAKDYGLYKFTLTTTNTTTSFQFSLSAVGTFTVDCGDGGTLISDASTNDDSNSNTITRTGTTKTIYTCIWDNAGAHTIGFDGTATDYNADTNTAAILFWGGEGDYTALLENTAKIASISGNLSTMFPYISGNSASGAQPRFIQTFYGTTNLTSIPSTLFANYTSGAESMFSYTFYDCTGLTSIPENLFFPNAQSVSGAEGMFWGTFGNCTSLTSIPSGLFSKITSGAESMFWSTFDRCTNLGCETVGCSTGTGYIPPNLFAGITPRGSNPTNTMSNTFSGTKLVENCPAETTQYVTGWEGSGTWNNKVACGPLQYTCSAGQYLPANQTTCASCQNGYTCAGGTYAFNTNSDQGIVANTINVTWLGATSAAIAANDAGTMTYGGDIRTPQSHDPNAVPIGKHFVGWKFIKYTPVEYIEGNGNQYINTEIALTNATLDTEVMFSTISSRNGIIGYNYAYSGSLRGRMGLSFGDSVVGGLGFAFGDSNNSGIATNEYVYGFETGVKYHINAVFTTQSATLTVNDVLKSSQYGIREHPAPIYIAGVNTGDTYGLKGRIYSAKIYDGNNVLVGDFIPVKDTNGVACMFDKVSGKFFYNIGTGNFTAGPDL